MLGLTSLAAVSAASKLTGKFCVPLLLRSFVLGVLLLGCAVGHCCPAAGAHASGSAGCPAGLEVPCPGGAGTFRLDGQFFSDHPDFGVERNWRKFAHISERDVDFAVSTQLEEAVVLQGLKFCFGQIGFAAYGVSL